MQLRQQTASQIDFAAVLSYITARCGIVVVLIISSWKIVSKTNKVLCVSEASALTKPTHQSYNLRLNNCTLNLNIIAKCFNSLQEHIL
jgi:hypothetical protein